MHAMARHPRTTPATVPQRGCVDSLKGSKKPAPRHEGSNLAEIILPSMSNKTFTPGFGVRARNYACIDSAVLFQTGFSSFFDIFSA